MVMAPLPPVICPVGHQAEGGCVPCPLGTFAPVVMPVCLDCSLGTSTVSPGATDPSQCVDVCTVPKVRGLSLSGNILDKSEVSFVLAQLNSHFH